MTINDSSYPKGHTLDHGRFAFNQLWRGTSRHGLWRGEQLRPHRRDVLIVLTSLHRSDELDALLRQDVPGLASVLFIGSPDGYRRPSQKTTKGWEIAVVETRPTGITLAEAGLLTAAEVVRVGVALCDVIQSWAARGPITRGLCPATVYVDGESGQRTLTGVTPRSFLLLGSDGMDTAFASYAYDAPSENAVFAASLEDGVFTIVLTLWYALLGEHAYEVPDHPYVYNNIWNDIRRPFTGPPELGRLFEAVLVADIDRRMKTAEFRSELERLARAWNVDLPPFPPPGLADA